jgi:ABC-type branched-subunit amino acid transport system ATPase component/sugar phosphate permease
LQVLVLVALGSDIGDVTGGGPGTITFAVALHALTYYLGSLRFAVETEARPNRAEIAARTAFVWAFITLITAFAASGSAIVAALAVAGFLRGAVFSVHPPLLMDSYETGVRGRVFGVWWGAQAFGTGAALIGFALAYRVWDLNWRSAFLVAGALAFVPVLVAEWLRDPGFGRHDEAKVRSTAAGADGASPSKHASTLGLGEIVRRLTLVGAFKQLLVAFAFLGVFAVPMQSFVNAFLDLRWNVFAEERAIVLGGMWLSAVPVALVAGRFIDVWFRRDPGAPLRYAGRAIGVAAVLVAVGANVPSFPVCVALLAAGYAVLWTVYPAAFLPVLSVIPPRHRAHAMALLGITSTLVGGLGGLIVFGGLDRRIGLSGVLVALLVPAVVAVFLFLRASRSVSSDLDKIVEETSEDAVLQATLVRGGTLPLLRCHGVDFSYGQLQVLFGVDFSISEQEMVALLGTNGAGKSTLLRVISGLGLPSRGTVHYRGEDVTFLDAERRVRLGIVQIPGGRAVFDPMTVVENIKVFGFAFDRDTKTIEKGMEAAFEAMPRLYERRNSRAQTLSGGERQMLGLAKSFVLRPRLLLIDELSLGLAPRIVSELLDTVRTINASGTAVVLVEQSVNVALSIVNHAYFMERGQIRFDGSATELLERPDLIRSVFLEGATKG